MSENRPQASSQFNQNTSEQYVDGKISKLDDQKGQELISEDLPYKQSAIVCPQNKITLVNQLINTQSSKNLSSISEQNTVLKKSLAHGDSNTQSKLSIKQMNNAHSTKQMDKSMGTSNKDKSQNSKYASCSPGIVKPAFVLN